MRSAAIVTTIQRPTAALLETARRALSAGMDVVVAGDSKSPADFTLEGAIYLSLTAQESSGYALARLLPVGHYARKNLGYIEAISRGAALLFETDDDNFPMESWSPREEKVAAQICLERGWVNGYRHFTSERIWPRGFPLEELARADVTLRVSESAVPVRAPIQQGLANGSPDVDAVWRMVMDMPFVFQDAASLLLPPGAWCPFNSQSTWWCPLAFPLLYLPSYCSFRMTDIWRGLVAQRCLWEMGFGIVFHPAEMFQQRNPHNLLRDFELEVPGFLSNARIARLLEALPLSPKEANVGANLLGCYEELVRHGFIDRRELSLVEAWLEDVAGTVKVP